MSIEFKPTSPQAAVKEDIILNGRKIGTIQLYENVHSVTEDKFQVQLHFSGLIYPGGFGATKDAAISNTIQIAAEMSATFAAEVSELRAELGEVEL